MKSKGKDIIIESKYPIIAYLGCLLYAFVAGLFAYNILLKDLPLMDGILILSIAFLTIDFILCGNSCKVVLKTKCFEVKYFFPWHTNHNIQFQRITDVESSTIGRRFRLYSRIFIEFDGNDGQYYNIQSNFGLLKDIYELESTIKSVFSLV